MVSYLRIEKMLFLPRKPYERLFSYKPRPTINPNRDTTRVDEPYVHMKGRTTINVITKLKVTHN